MPRVVVAFAVALAFAIGHGVNDDGEGHERDSAEEEEGIGGRADEVTGNSTDDESQADADGECNGKSGDVDGSDEKQVGDVEDNSAADGPEYARGRCLLPRLRGTGEPVSPADPAVSPSAMAPSEKAEA